MKLSWNKLFLCSANSKAEFNRSKLSNMSFAEVGTHCLILHTKKTPRRQQRGLWMHTLTPGALVLSLFVTAHPHRKIQTTMNGKKRISWSIKWFQNNHVSTLLLYLAHQTHCQDIMGCHLPVTVPFTCFLSFLLLCCHSVVTHLTPRCSCRRSIQLKGSVNATELLELDKTTMTYFVLFLLRRLRVVTVFTSLRRTSPDQCR
jgi:hypothetical protein